MADDEKTGDGRVVIPFPMPRHSSKRHVPTDQLREMVHRAAGMGLTREQIAVMLKIHPATLAKRYKVELATAQPLLNFNVAQNLYMVATDPKHPRSVVAGMFWLKTRAGWRETTRHEHVGENGQPIQHEVRAADTIDVRTLTQGDRQALKETLIEALAQQALPPVAGEEIIDGEFVEVHGEGYEDPDEDDDET